MSARALALALARVCMCVRVSSLRECVREKGVTEG